MHDELLLGKTRAAVLREIYLNPGRRVSFNELVRRVRSGAGAISRELSLLAEAGLIVEQREGVHRFISAATGSPLYAELKAFIAKASGARAVIREALHGVESKLDIVLIFGSVAKGTERPDSDLDLFVIGTAGYSVVTQHLYPIEERLGRKVQTVYFDATSTLDRVSLNKPAMKALLAGPKIFIIGDEARLEALFAKEGEDHGRKNKSRQPDKGKPSRPPRR